MSEGHLELTAGTYIQQNFQPSRKWDRSENLPHIRINVNAE